MICRRNRKWASICVMTIVVMLVSIPAFADENPVANFFKKLFKFPVKTTEDVGGATAGGVENTGGVLQATGRNIGATLTGESEKVDVAEPLHKTGAGVEDFVSGVAGAPVKAIEEIEAEEAPRAE